MGIRVGINGFGRIGRNFFRAQHALGADIAVVALNDLGDARTMAYLLRYDSNLGPFPGEVELADGVLRAAGEEIRMLSERDPAALPWAELGVDVVLESTGFFTDRPGAQKHLDAGAKKVVISAPATDPDITVVLGVNDDAYDPAAHDIVSNASCTTNCVAPMAKILHELGEIESGFMTTIHAYTNDQVILDFPHKDLRRARAAAINLIPTTTGAAKAIGLVLPELQGKVDGISVRAPVATGSLTDLVVSLGRETTVDEVKDAFRRASRADLAGILEYSEDPIVSTDVNGSGFSCIFDSELTMVRGSSVKVFGWYDNEWGYSCRLVDLIGKLLG
ncbi:MAG TPA: type I glyceraldehyde-3-phosphate dehydrogenase [Gaiellaceae bacterium]|jgi:glyceraldehyde 3-phosphate dehydrogenase|nr:type I glyceraldehyde-3-phosphate dehydrogenase [Gaiellaceae bacterium]